MNSSLMSMVFNFNKVSLLWFLLLVSSAKSTWWLSDLQIAAVGSNTQTKDVLCAFPAKKRKQMCKNNSEVIYRVMDGVTLGVKECNHQFIDHRWNCTTLDGKIKMLKGSREAAFAYSISSAGVVHAITRACSRGELSNCECNRNKRGKGRQRDAKGDFLWGGCSENVRFGRKFARRFIDATERKPTDVYAHMNLHNNKAGRKAVMKKLTKACKCHGVSGSCTTRTCWVALNDFHKVGKYLKKKYNRAVKITSINTSNRGSKKIKLVPENPNHKTPSGYDMVYYNPSPDYCQYDLSTGSLGTAGRKCNRDSKGTDGCDIMCCGRGYDTKRVRKINKCNCTFYWCCYVKCKTCIETVEEYYCKSSSESNYYTFYGNKPTSNNYIRNSRDLRQQYSSPESQDPVKKVIAKIKSMKLS